MGKNKTVLDVTGNLIGNNLEAKMWVRDKDQLQPVRGHKVILALHSAAPYTHRHWQIQLERKYPTILILKIQTFSVKFELFFHGCCYKEISNILEKAKKLTTPNLSSWVNWFSCLKSGFLGTETTGWQSTSENFNIKIDRFRWYPVSNQSLIHI